MRTVCALSLAFLLLGCGAATQAPAEPEVVWNPFEAEGLHLSAPAGWNQPFHRVDENQPERNYSQITLQNQAGQIIMVLHPRGDAQYAERVFLSTYMRQALIAAACAQQPELLERLEMQSITVSEPVELAGTEGTYFYLITTVRLDGTTEENRILMMMLQPPDSSTTILVSTTVPADESEQFPAEVLEIVHTLRYIPQE